jgi:hypothetical protein
MYPLRLVVARLRMETMEIIIENVRTFSGRHQVPIRPLTILTGENSSGKTAFLACLSAVTDPIGFPLNPEFNDPPYSLGSYDTIAAYRGRSTARAESFSLGWTDVPGELRGVATYTRHAGIPRLHAFEGGRAGGVVTLAADGEGEAYNVSLRLPGAGDSRQFHFQHSSVLPRQGLVSFVLYGLMNSRARGPRTKYYPAIVDFLLGYTSPPRTKSIAPIRTKPERTYEPADEMFNPEGRHTPFLLAKWLGETGQWGSVLSALEKFGAESGLFKEIGIKHLGKHGTDPFQVLVNVVGRPVNLLDVGYGVSQSLPVVLESLFSFDDPILLLQQPEVHLHPRAQAALGSFFSRVVAATYGERQFVIETHSDYLVGRIRQEVARRTVDYESVLILYFERKGLSTTIHPLTLDPSGNILDAPKSYRDFFLQEESDLLSRAF